MPALHPRNDQIDGLRKDPYEGPLSQVNLLKFREKAAYSADDPECGDECSGQEAYFRYSEAFTELGLEFGCVTSLVATTERYFIGGGDWDCVLVNTFPNRRAFLKTISHSNYKTISRHRRAGLLCQELIVTRPLWQNGEQMPDHE